MRSTLTASHGGDFYRPPILPFVTYHAGPMLITPRFHRGSSHPHRIRNRHRAVHHSAR